MRTLIHNTVTTDCSRYTFKTREEAEAFFIATALRERAQQSPGAGPERSAASLFTSARPDCFARKALATARPSA